ncbi:MAG: hypothetical protein ICV69_13630 [Thermoleophilaceae bacterium]|nr:hypothetical protein [Thermoleophilaceae bacterium]
MTNTLPDDARVVKTIGDEVMIVGQDIGQVKLKGIDEPRRLYRAALCG